MLIFVTFENKKMSKRKPNWTDRENVVLLEEYEKRSYFESKVFLVDDFWGRKKGMAGNCKHSKCRDLYPL
jgi:hypothetical protein